MRERVVITGVGTISAYGVGIDPLWEAMLAGRTSIRLIDRFAEAGMPCPFAAEMDRDQFDVRKIVPKSYRKATKVMCRDIELAVGAAAAAVDNAGLVTKGNDADSEPTFPPGRLGCHIGAGLIAADVDELTAALISSDSGQTDAEGAPAFDIGHWGHTGMQDLTPLWLLKYLPNMLACHVTIIHDCQGPSNTLTCCEASGALCLGESLRVIDRGAADACLTGGAEYKLNPMALARQYFAGRLATPSADEDAATIVRPFDPDASGTVLGEGGGILVLETHDAATRRDAATYAEVVGFASTQSHCPDTIGLDLSADDESLADAIRIALDQAETSPDAIDAVVPFAPSIPNLDAVEATALHQVFNGRAAEIPVITTVPYTGNCNAGNGGIALGVAAKAIREQHMPARLNTTGVTNLDANACDAHPAKLDRVLVCTTSQGGQNAAVVLKKHV
jgi:3-oxoacyl-[acyl-carrier-protein] synthase II